MTSAIALRVPARPPREAAADTPAAPFAQLAQALAKTMMQGVRDAANLNVATAQALLAPADGSVKGDLNRVTEAWRFSWRTYEICATTAADVMRLSEVHARKSLDALWQLFEREIDGKPGFDRAQTAELRAALEALHAAQTAVFDAAIEAHRRLIALAAGAR
jgi:hypothetical protein